MPDSFSFTHNQTQVRQPYADVLLNRYRIMEAPKPGGFGTVLVCWDTRLQRRVAIKRLPLTGGGPQSTISEALNEARTSSMLQDANIVTVFDFEVEGPYAYLVMEYVDGMSLTELLSRVEGGVLTHDEAAHLVESVASALHHAHENHVLHLDIKPANIIIDREGNVKLCDFGMATLASAAGVGGARGGTVGYMPPEQIEGDLVDERTDVFALAVVTWQSILGYNPFAAKSAEESLALIRKGPGKPSKLDPSLAGMAEEALLGAMEASPSSRIPSVDVLAKQLVFGLGNPQAGKQSLHALISQDPSSLEDDLEDWEGERLPLCVSYPWIPGAFTRLTTALATLYLALPLTSVLVNQSSTTIIGAAAGCSLAAALWPPLGSALIILGLCAAVALNASGTIPLLFAVVIGVLFVLWWATCGLRSRLSSLALLLPACLNSPIAGVAVAGASLRPAAALFTAAASWFVGLIWPTAVEAHFALDGLVDVLIFSVATRHALLSLAGCMIAAALCSAVTWHRETSGYAVAGQVLGCAVLVGSQLMAARMENGGIWVDPSWENTGVAVLLSVLVCIACILHGPREVALESED